MRAADLAAEKGASSCLTVIQFQLQMWNRPIRLIQCCIQFKFPGVTILCVLYLPYNVAFTFI